MGRDPVRRVDKLTMRRSRTRIRGGELLAAFGSVLWDDEGREDPVAVGEVSVVRGRIGGAAIGRRPLAGGNGGGDASDGGKEWARENWGCGSRIVSGGGDDGPRFLELWWALGLVGLRGLFVAIKHFFRVLFLTERGRETC